MKSVDVTITKKSELLSEIEICIKIFNESDNCKKIEEYNLNLLREYHSFSNSFCIGDSTKIIMNEIMDLYNEKRKKNCKCTNLRMVDYIDSDKCICLECGQIYSVKLLINNLIDKIGGIK